MDQKKIGAFIAQCRKEKSLTQIQLAELLDITNQAVSKWENGRGMPDVSLLQPLCDALGISLNELFSGEHISAEEYKGKAEENISKLYKEKQIANLKPIKYLFSTCSNVTLLVAVIELAVGFIGNFFDPIILKVMLLNASVWIMLFLISVGKLTYDKKKLKNLKHSGTCIDSEIKDIIPASWIRVGNYICCRIVCGFIYEGKEYKAVSNYYVLTPFQRKEDLYANVFIEQNPVSVIKSACEYGETYGETLEEQRETLAMIHRQADKMSQLIDQLLRITRLDQGTELARRERVDLAALAREVCAEGPWPQDRLTLEGGEPVFAQVDRALIARLLQNLIDNGFKYGKPGGGVWVTLRRQGGEALLTVRDDGIGIAPDQQARVWQRFYQVDPVRGEKSGAGLGLSMVWKIAQAHGGHMSLESVPGQGSSFTLHLPAER